MSEAVLGITNDFVNGSVDQIHASVQIQGSQFQGYSDAFLGNGTLHGGSHYPRGISTSLWWLNATNNPPNPVSTALPGTPAFSSALAGDQKILLLWQGVPFAAAYNLKRATISGGPYGSVTNGLVGASFVDSGLVNGTTYYYVLTATNQFGESVPSPEVSATPVPSVGSSISAVSSGSGVTVSWPPAYVGWILQTNTVGLSSPAAWGDVPNSHLNSQMTFPVGGQHEFFRLRHP